MTRSFPFAVLAVLLLAACQPAADAPAGPAVPATDAAPVTDAAPASPAAGGEQAAATDPDAGPRLRVETLDHGTFDLAGHRGQWVVVNFWATWCKPCLKEIPDLAAFDAAREDVTVVGLAYEEIEPDAMRAFLQEHPAGYPIAILDVYDPPADFDTPRGLPLTYLIDPAGRVAKRFLGPVTSQELAEAIAGTAP